MVTAAGVVLVTARVVVHGARVGRAAPVAARRLAPLSGPLLTYTAAQRLAASALAEASGVRE